MPLYIRGISASAAEDVYRPVEDTPVADIERVYADAAVHGHNLRNLLEAISDDVQSQLGDAFENTALGQQEGSLGQFLYKFEELIVASRYPFEEKARRIDRYPSLDGLLALIRLLHEFTHRLAGGTISTSFR